jgi:PAS domain S-box-containing protein
VESFWLVLSLGVVVLPILFTLRSLERLPAGGMWAAAWVLLWIGGLCTEVSTRYPMLWVFAAVAGPFFATFMLTGSLAFTGRPVPRWIWFAAAGIVGARLVATLWGSTQLSIGVGAVLEGPLLAAAAVLLWRPPPPQRVAPAERVVALALLGLGILAGLDWLGWPRSRAGDALILGAWIGMAILGGFFQLFAILQKSRAQERRRSEERGLLRRLAAAVTHAHEPYAVLARAGAGMRALGSYPIFGIYVPDPKGEGYELLQDPDAPPLAPQELRFLKRNHPILLAAEAAEGPIFIEDVATDPRVAPTFRDLGFQRAVIAPLRYGGEFLGLMGVGLAPDRLIDADLRRFVGELVDELGLILAALRLQRRMAEHARSLESEWLTLQALVEAAPVGILLADAEGRVRLVNKLVADHLGVGPPETWRGRLKRDVIELAHPSLQKAFGERAVEALEAAMLDPDSRLDGVELRSRGADGEQIVLLDARPVLDGEGRRIGRVWTTHDITAERRVAQALGHAQRMETLGTLASGLAHDFNNQLTAILGNARLLLDELPQSDSRRASLVDLERSAEYCADLTRSLLTFARQGSISPRAVDLAAVLRDLEPIFRPSVGTEVRLDIAVAPDLPPLAADESQLRRVLTNLVMNARDAVRARGSGHIRVEARVGKHLGEGAGPAAEISVEDDGLGMDEATRRRIFDPFFTTKPTGSGTGLGLAIVYGIVEAHGGEISVESAPGRGSAFRMLWPTVVAGGSEGIGSVEPTDPPGGLVLLAEDDPGVRRLTRVALERSGFQVVEAEDGVTAVERFRDHRDQVRLLVVDLIMPRKGGLEAVADIHRMAPELPVLVVSGQLDRVGASALPEGTPFLAKPFSPRALVQRVSELVAATSLR